MSCPVRIMGRTYHASGSNIKQKYLFSFSLALHDAVGVLWATNPNDGKGRMKAEITEHDGCFEISLRAESIDDVADLVRFGCHKTRALRSAMIYLTRRNDRMDATGNGAERASACLVIGRKKNASPTVGS